MKLSRASAVVMTVSAISAVFGLLRETVVAAEFGTSFATDAYFFSFDLTARLPEFLVPAIGGALVPVYMRSRREQGDDRFSSTVINAFALALGVVTLILAVATPAVISMAGSGFAGDQRSLVVEMSRLLSPALTILGIAGVLRTLLNSEDKFFVAQVSQVWLSLGIVGATLFLAPRIGVQGLAVGVLIGSTVQLVWTGFWLRRGGFRYRLIMDLRDPRFRRFLQLLAPGVIGAMLSWFIPIFDKWLAANLAEGSIASLNFASRPVALLSRLGINSIVVAALPVLTERALHDGRAHFRASVERTLRVIAFAVLPISAILATLRMPVIEFLFERGAFDAAAAQRTAGVFAASVIQLAPAGFAVVLSTAFNSVEDAKTPAFYGAGGNVIVKLIAGPLLMIPLGVAGLALSTSIMYAASAVVLMWRYTRLIGHTDLRGLLSSLVRTALASAGAALAVEFFVRWADLSAFPMLLTGATIGALVFLAIAAVLRSPELRFFLERLQAFRANARA